MHRQRSFLLVATLTLIIGVSALLAACSVIQRPARSTPTPIATQASVLPTTTHTASLPVVVAPQPTATQRTPEPIYLPDVLSLHPTPTYTATPSPTPQPTATPIPTMPWPDALEKPGRSKLGLHVQWNNSPDIIEFTRRMKPAVIKGVDDLGFMDEVKKVSPSTVTIGRLSRDAQNTDGDPIQRARSYVAANLAEYKRFPGVDYWEGLNEPGVRGRMDWYAAFEVERVRLMAEQGLHCAVGAFSAGVPEWDEMAAFLPAIQAAQKNKGIFTLHEYDAPTMDRAVGASLPGRPAYANRGALALRYRWWYEDFMKPRGLVIPLVISEAGIDGTVGDHNGPKGRGWQDYTGYWGDHGLDRDGVRAYTKQLAWYDGELQKDPYVIGFTVFTTGAMSADWSSYDVTSILRQIATWIIVPAAK
jgi:hypothetical protein